MAQILKFPAQASKLGFKRVKKRKEPVENPDQLHLFPRPSAQILSFNSALSCFEQALMLDERGDAGAADLYARAIEENDCIADAGAISASSNRKEETPSKRSIVLPPRSNI